MTNDFIIGSDPEFFCRDISTGEFISMIPFTKGTKKRPKNIEIKGCSQLRDGVSIELNLPPMPEFWMLHKIISDCIDYTNKWLADINPNYQLYITSSADFDFEHLKHIEAIEFGCDPAYSIYNGNLPLPPPTPIAAGSLRTASYHIHYGWDREWEKSELLDFIFLNDVFLGFPAIFIDESDIRRKKLYGKLGEHRIKKDGCFYSQIKKSNRIEYRTLGAGMHRYPEVIEMGIKKISENIAEASIFVKEYKEDFTKLFNDPTNGEIKNIIKSKLISNGHFII